MRIAIVTQASADPAHRALLGALAELDCPAEAVAPAGERPLQARLAELGPDLVHVDEAPWTPAAVAAVRAAARLGAAAVVALRRDVRGLGFGERWRRRRVLAAAAAATAPDERTAAAALKQRPGLPIAVLPALPVLAPEAPTRRPVDETLRIGFAGRLAPGCGLDLLLRAAARVHGAWTIDVIGTGPDQEGLERLTERLGAGSRVRWHGTLPREARGARWDALDVVVMPAYSEQPAAVARLLAEAMAHGVGVILGPAPALRDVAGDAALHVTVQEPLDLAETLQRLLAAPAERARLAEAAHAYALQRFTPAAVARGLAALWARALEAKSGAKS